MNARKLLLSASAALALSLTSCGTLMRAGKDAILGVGTPILMVYGGANDGLSTSKGIREGLGSNGAVEALSFPFTFAYHAIEHGIYGFVHLVDLPLCAFYWMAEVHPQDVAPLQIYYTPIDRAYEAYARARHHVPVLDPTSGETTGN